MSKLTHIDQSGKATMVDVGHKDETKREAVVRGQVTMKPETLQLIREGNIKKGDVLSIARIAGIMAAKRTAEIIPLCHPLMLTYIDVQLTLTEPPEAPAVLIEARVKTRGKTGVEMEALTAASAAALTIYDMAKAVDRGMRIDAIRLVEKRGGQSGEIILE